MQPSTERLHALDAARAIALLLGIAFHATMSFLPGSQKVWIVTDSSHSLMLSALFFTLHMFRMSAFFLLAGFFAHMSFHKKGLRGFVRDRLKRIGIPLVVGWPILFAMIVAVAIWGATVMAHGGPLPKPPPSQPFPAFPLTHLWFLYVLLWLYAATLLLRGFIQRLDRQGKLKAIADVVVRRAIEIPFGYALLAAPTALTFILIPQWLQWFGIFTPDSSLVPNLQAVIGFGTAFGFGWLLHRQTDLLAVLRARWLVHLAAAVACTVAALSITGIAPFLQVAPHTDLTALYAACYALGIWSWSFALIGVCLRFLSSHSARWRYIADSSYWLYLMHLPLVMALQVALSQLAVPWWLKFPLVLAVALPILLVTYHLLVRFTFIGSILNGRRESRSSVPAAPPQPEPAE